MSVSTKYRGTDLRDAFTALQTKYRAQGKSSLFASYMFAPAMARGVAELNVAEIMGAHSHAMVVVDVPTETAIYATKSAPRDWKVGTTTGIDHSADFNKRYRLHTMTEVWDRWPVETGPAIYWLQTPLDAVRIAVPSSDTNGLKYENVNGNEVGAIVRHVMHTAGRRQAPENEVHKLTSVSVVVLTPGDTFARIGWCSAYTADDTLTEGLAVGKTTAFTILSVGAPTYTRPNCGNRVTFAHRVDRHRPISGFEVAATRLRNHDVQVRPLPATFPTFVQNAPRPTTYVFFNPELIDAASVTAANMTVAPAPSAITAPIVLLIPPVAPVKRCRAQRCPATQCPRWPALVNHIWLLLGVILTMFLIIVFSHSC